MVALSALGAKSPTSPTTETAPAAGKTGKIKVPAATPAPAYESKMLRVRLLLAELRAEVEKYQYEGLFLSPGDKPVEGLVAFSAEKFNEKVDEIAKIAKECREQMSQRQKLARDYYQKTGAPQAAAFSACQEGMEETAKLIEQLRQSASRVGSYSKDKDAKYVLELSRLDRTISVISAMMESCQRNMDRAEILCGMFDSKPTPKPKPATLTY
ncbi:MAG: hypothetical protein N3D11_00255 [Candidatus Sumerlaeia bacterium]|nr:hypothetical protein [Candidatus Sumerlaeia bacterium]